MTEQWGRMVWEIVVCNTDSDIFTWHDVAALYHFELDEDIIEIICG